MLTPFSAILPGRSRWATLLPLMWPTNASSSPLHAPPMPPSLYKTNRPSLPHRSVHEKRIHRRPKTKPGANTNTQVAEMANEALGLEITELRLGLPGVVEKKNIKKRAFSEIAAPAPAPAVVEDEHSASGDAEDDQAKNRVVGWPPICSYRQKNSPSDKKNTHDGSEAAAAAKIYVKVSMDGAPFLRKIDLNLYKGYSHLSVAFQKLFKCFGIGTLAGKRVEDSEYVPIYEDKDGDWMLVGDVPWEMFIESCKRLRIMKRSEANGIGLQLRGDHGGGFRRPPPETEAEHEG